jgi:hypothetical protein
MASPSLLDLSLSSIHKRDFPLKLHLPLFLEEFCDALFISQEPQLLDRLLDTLRLIIQSPHDRTHITKKKPNHRNREMRDRKDGERYLVGRRTSCNLRKTDGLLFEKDEFFKKSPETNERDRSFCGNLNGVLIKTGKELFLSIYLFRDS